jgi:hypothetical protein
MNSATAFATTAEAIKSCSGHRRYLAAARSIWRAAGQVSDRDEVRQLSRRQRQRSVVTGGSRCRQLREVAPDQPGFNAGREQALQYQLRKGYGCLQH